MKVFPVLLLMVLMPFARAMASPAHPLPHECQPWAEFCPACKDCSRCKYCAVGGGECSVKRALREKAEAAKKAKP